MKGGFAAAVLALVFVGGTFARPNEQKDIILMMDNDSSDSEQEASRLPRDEPAEGSSVSRGPKNVALFFARYPSFGNTSGDDEGSNRGVYLDFPFRSTLQSFKPDSFSPRLVTSPSERRGNSSGQSCQSTLDRSVAALIAWARLEQMETGVVSSAQFSIEETMGVRSRSVKRDLSSRKTGGAEDLVSLKGNALAELRDQDYCQDENDGNEPNPWGAFDVVANMRRLWFHKVANFLGFNLENEIEDDLLLLSPPCETPLGGLVRDLMRELQNKAADKGFLLVVTAGDQRELEEVVKIVTQKTCPGDTLVAVTGQCSGDPVEATRGADRSRLWQLDPDNQLIFDTKNQQLVPRRKRELECVPLYAQGPKSDKLVCVKGLWDLPDKLQSILQERNVVPGNKCPRSPVMLKLPSNKYYTGLGNRNDNGLNKKSFLDKKTPPRDFFPASPHHVSERDADVIDMPSDQHLVGVCCVASTSSVGKFLVAVVVAIHFI